jgi:steroid delta-isomerase-like uncharacterized protein
MSTEDNKALAHRGFEETLNQRNLAVVDELHVPDFVYHNASRTIHGLESFKQYLSMLLTAFPDLRVTIEDMIGEGDRVVVRFTFRGTHQGDLRGIPPTGKQVAVRGIDILCAANGKVVEEWANIDELGLMQQLGVILVPGQAS